MLKPRPLPPAHKNQLFVPVKSIGFYSDPHPPNVFRNHEITKKKLKSKHTGYFSPSTLKTDEDRDESDCKETPTSPKDSVTSLMHVRGRASMTDVTQSVTSMDEVRKSATPEAEDTNLIQLSFLTEDPTSSRSYNGRSPSFSPVLACSKYNVIGEPKFRKKRSQRSVWSLPKIAPKQGFVEPQDSSHPKTNSIDLRSIYGTKSKVQQVLAPEVKKEDTVILPPLEIGTRRQEVKRSVDSNSLAEKRLVMETDRHHNFYRKIFRDHVAFPTAYKPYFRFRQRKHRFVRSLFSTQDFWENNPQPVHCSRCVHQSTATLHYCDVLGKRFCRFCSEMADRGFSHVYERNRLLAASPHKSPTLHLMQEPSFIGVRKIVITKTARDEGQGQKLHLDSDIGQAETE